MKNKAAELSIDINEHVLNFTEHTHSFVRVLDNDTITPLFTNDISGRVVFTPDPECGVSEYKYSKNSILVKFKEHCFMPFPWHMKSDEFYHQLTQFIKHSEGSFREKILLTYPGSRLAQTAELYIPFSEKPISTERALSIIDAIEDTCANDDLVIDATIMLQESGIIRIPQLDSYKPTYHEVTHGSPSEGDPVSSLSHGWVSRESVLRRSKVVALQ